MRRSVLVFVLAAIIVAPAAAQRQDRVARTISEEFDAGRHEAVELRLDVGSVQIEGIGGNTIRVVVEVQCNRRRDRARCEDRAEDIELDSYERRGRLVLAVDGTGWWRSRDATVEVRVGLPRALAAEITLGTGELRATGLSGAITVSMDIGEITLTDVSGDVSVDLGIGDVSITMPQSAVGEVILDNGLGETELRHRDGRNGVSGILGGTDVHWTSGSGPRTVRVELNIGEILVRLQ